MKGCRWYGVSISGKPFGDYIFDGDAGRPEASLSGLLSRTEPTSLVREEQGCALAGVEARANQDAELTDLLLHELDTM